MATEPTYGTTEHGKSAMDYNEHHKTYGLFVGLTKWVVIITVILLAMMAATLV
jgi:hypothetical protein